MEPHSASASRAYRRTSTTSSSVSTVGRFRSAANSERLRPPQRTPTFSRYRNPINYDDESVNSEIHDAAAPRYQDEESTSSRLFSASRIRGRFAKSAAKSAPRGADRSFRTPDRQLKTLDRQFRTPDRTDSRVDRGQFSASYRSRMHEAERELDTDIIEKTPAKEKNDEWLESLGFDLAVLKLSSHTKEDAENRHPNITPPRFAANAYDKALSKQASPLPAEMPLALRYEDDSSETIPVPSESAPALTESTEFSDETSDVITRNTPRRSFIPEYNHRNPSSSAFERGDKGVGKPGMYRRHTDLHFGTASTTTQDTAPDSMTPSRVRSARKSRRASARVSSRELRGIFEAQEGGGAVLAAEPDIVGTRQSARRSLARRSMRLEDMEQVAGVAGNVQPKGATVMLSPVRASKQQLDALGANTVVTPVRRSLRISQRHMPAVRFPNVAEENAQRLDSANYAYVPNHSMKDMLDNEPKTPLR